MESLGFFGPATVDSAEYAVTVYVETPSFDMKYPWYFHFLPWLTSPGKIYGRYNGTIRAEKGNMLYTTFDNPIHIPEDVWIGITFRLEVLLMICI